MQSTTSNQRTTSNSSSWVVVVIIIALVIGIGSYYLFSKNNESQVIELPTIEKEEQAPVEEFVEVIKPTIEESIEPIEDTVQVQAPIVEEPIIEKPLLPLLNDSDNWIKEKLTSLTWRKELLKLVIDDDMVRRLVVFTDNFAQGLVVYEHSPLIKPSTKFSVLSELDSNSQVWHWDENSTKRFDLYVEFLRSFEVESLVDWYFEIKPLIDEAYTELGYPDDDFTETMQDAIARVLDMDIPKDEMNLVRPSVMYKYESQTLESLSSSEKLLLRLGKDNLLVIKSVLLEFSDKLGRRRGE